MAPAAGRAAVGRAGGGRRAAVARPMSASVRNALKSGTGSITVMEPVQLFIGLQGENYQYFGVKVICFLL